MLEDRGQLASDVGQQPAELGLHGVLVGLVVHRVEHRLDSRPHALGRHRHQIRAEVSAAALASRAGQVRRDRLDQAGEELSTPHRSRW